MSIPLSVLDLSPIDTGQTSTQALRNTIELGRHAERLGYKRFWLGEHHNVSTMVSACPEIMIGQVAQITTHIRVGSGGIMLPHYSSLKIVETFRTLHALFPGRIDLGIGRAFGTDPLTTQALRRSRTLTNDFSDQLTDLFGFASDNLSENHPFHSVRATPTDVPLPPVWLLGSSEYGAQNAARRGRGFVYAHHINPSGTEYAVKLYQDTFQPSEELKQPATIISVTVMCAATERELEEISAPMMLSWVRLYSQSPGPIPSPQEALAYHYTPLEEAQTHVASAQCIMGTAEQVREQLDQIVFVTGADELLLTTFVYGHENRLRIYEEIAQQYCLQP